ncbi:Dual specificity protein phosphatase 3 [Holothuria leucospilota]|uniref:Dual specificity protein phosphatase n=1 Tax=Holothuria leucospilota TaxID=206669 RepID=A0A9Q1BDK0_HOLLE|nr:Dual specificity protein phosphatase 3 [Holothuria leucospilota]
MAAQDGSDSPLCTPMELEGILTDDSGFLRMPSHSYNEITSGLYLGSRSPALNKTLLKKLGVTHVLNSAEGKKFMHVDTNAEYYKDLDIKYLGLQCSDFYTTKISEHFDTAVDFIDEALSSGGKILVHCVEGYSRSSTLVIAYFMIKKGMTVQAATGFVRAKREIGPNDGFLEQLCQLNEKLQRANRTDQEQ